MPKYLYTRCPSCQAEIKFEAPDMQDKPEDYKPLVKCPTCGVTIAVDLSAPVETVVPEPEVAPEEPVETVEPEKPEEVVAKPAKKSGVGRNIVIMIISLIFVGMCTVGYLIAKRTIKVGDDMTWLQSLAWYYSGIMSFDVLVNDTAAFKECFDPIGYGIVGLIIPMLLFVMACVNFIVAFVSVLGKKYGRAYNVISGILVGGSAIITLFSQYLLIYITDKGIAGSFGEYMKNIANADYAFLFAGAALGLLLIILVLCFTKSLEQRSKE